MNRFLLISLSAFLFPLTAHAQCTMPSGPPAEAGVIVFNTDHKVMQYCNGDKWIGLWGGGGSVDLDNLNASNLTSGIVPKERLGSGTADDTTFLRGDGIWAAEADPKVGAATNNKWCRGTGSQVTCDQDAPSGGGITAVTTATCTTSGGNPGYVPHTCTVSCPAGYYRTGCNYSGFFNAHLNFYPSGSSCFCTTHGDPVVCRAVCAK